MEAEYLPHGLFIEILTQRQERIDVPPSILLAAVVPTEAYLDRRARRVDRLMRLRSLLFVPGDRPERFGKAAASGADALIRDLEDSVAPDNKQAARRAVVEWLSAQRHISAFVRVNPVDTPYFASDLAAILDARPDGLVLPKAEGAITLRELRSRAAGALPPILPIASETANAIFGLSSFREVAADLAGLTWGVEDLSSAVGAVAPRGPDGDYTSPFAVARALTLFAAHAAEVPAIETVFPDIAAPAALAACVTRARRDGFTGMMAIHPNQITIINAGFTPSAEEMARARAIVAAFDATPHAGVVKLGGKMIDRPHLLQARRVLSFF